MDSPDRHYAEMRTSERRGRRWRNQLSETTGQHHAAVGQASAGWALGRRQMPRWMYGAHSSGLVESVWRRERMAW
jgi:hypothetical protein